MLPRRILVCEAQVPFVRGGAESLVRELVAQLRLRGFEADLGQRLERLRNRFKKN